MIIQQFNIKDFIRINILVLFLTSLQFLREITLVYELILTISFLTYIYIFRKSVLSIFLFFLFFEFLMPPVPNEITLSPILFILFGIMLLFKILMKDGKFTLNKNITFVIAIVSSLYLITIVFYSIIVKGVSVHSVFTSLIPFFMYLYILLILDNGYTKREFTLNKLFDYLYIWGMLYVINNFALFLYNILIGRPLSYRITLYDYNTLSPVILLVLSLVIFQYLKNNSNNKLILLILFISLSSVLPQTRSYILATTLLLTYLYLKTLVTMNFSKSMTMIGISILSLFLILKFNILDPIFARFQSAVDGDQNVSERFIEYDLAKNLFFENPLFGIGFGADFNVRHGELVNYIHSFPYYILANLGFFGIIPFSLILLLSLFIFFIIKSFEVKSIIISGLVMIFYSAFFAIYKWFSFGMIVGIVIWFIIYATYYLKKDSTGNDNYEA
ncbi:hypothetical protein NSS69_02525 [Macrococcus sp. FSL W8-0367]